MDRVPDLVRRTLIFLGLIALILLVTDFNNRMAELARVTAQHSNESRQLTGLVQTEVDLGELIEYATSDEAAEGWARGPADMLQPGDYAFIPSTSEAFTPEVQTAATPAPEPLTNWQIWMAWLLNREP